MITHESDHWPVRRWAIQQVSEHVPHAVPRVSVFMSARERDAWVAATPTKRIAVGKRHPLVKSLRREWAKRARIRSASTSKEPRL